MCRVYCGDLAPQVKIKKTEDIRKMKEDRKG